MFSNNQPSYTFGTDSTYSTDLPIEINPETLGNAESSYRFVEPIEGGGGGSTPITDYVPKSTGGTFDALIEYTTTPTISGDNDIVYKKWVDDAIVAALGGSAVIDYSLARPYFSSSADTPLTYASATGIFTLNKNLSQYINDAGFLTGYTVTELDVTAHQAALTIYTIQIPDFETGLSTSFNTLFDARLLVSSLTGLGTKNHSDLDNISPDASSQYHLTLAQHIIATQAADSTHDGYLTSSDWNIFNGKLDTFTAGTGITYSGGTVSTKDSEIDHNSLLNYNIIYHRSINDSGTANTDLWSASKIITYVADANISFTDITTNNASTSKHGFLPKLANDTSKYLRSDGAWIAIPVTGDFLDAVIRMVVDNGFDPGATPTNGDRYIIMDSGSIHTNFGTINKMLDGSSRTLENNDLVQYVSAAAEFRIAYDANTSTMPVTVSVGTDKLGGLNKDWSYNITDDVWVLRSDTSSSLHNSMPDLNTGIGQYYHLTSDQHDLVAGITSSYTELNYLDGTVPANTYVMYGDGTKITSNSAFTFNSGTGIVTATGFVGNLTGNVTGSADTWTTARLLAGNSVNGSANVPFANKFIVQGISDSGLSAAQFLGSLNTGLVKNTTTTGVLSIASAGTDYQPALSLTSGYVPYATGTYTLANSPIQTDGTYVSINTTPSTSYNFLVSGSIRGTTISASNSCIAASYLGSPNFTTSISSGAAISIFPQSTTSPYIRFGVGNNNSTFTTEWARFQGANLGVGVTNPSYKVDVNGDVNIATGSHYKINGANLTIDNLISGTQGDILYHNGTNFVVLGAGTNGYFLKTQGVGANPVWAASSAVPAGSDTYVQFNDGGSFGGDSGLVYNKTTDALTCLGIISGSNIETNTTSLSTRLGINAGHSENESSELDNVFIGYNSGYSNTTGNNNIMIGKDAGYSNSTGYSNITIGYQSGYYLTYASNNILLGDNSGLRITSGSNNVIVGHSAGSYLTETSGNTFIGKDTGYSNTGQLNTYIGYQAGKNGTSASSNIFIGYTAGYYETASNKLFIDNQTRTNEATSRTSSLIYGIFNATPASQELYLNSKLYVRYLTNASTSTCVYYDTSTKELSYGSISAGSPKLTSFYTDASTSGTGLTDLYTYTIPANTLASDGDVISAFFTLTSSTAMGTYTILLGGSSSTSTTLDWSSSSPVNIDIHIIRVSSSAVRIRITESAANLVVRTVYNSWSGYTFSNTITFKVQATASTNTITAKLGYINKY